MTLEKLKQYNGENRQKAYVAYKGNIYDVSASPLWKNGIHKKIHKAGLDLTSAMEHAPHAEEVFSGFAIVDKKRNGIIFINKGQLIIAQQFPYLCDVNTQHSGKCIVIEMKKAWCVDGQFHWSQSRRIGFKLNG